MSRLGDANLAVPIQDRDDFTWFVFYSCDECGYGSLGMLSMNEDNYYDLRSRYDQAPNTQFLTHEESIETMTAVVNWYSESLQPDVTWYPMMSIGREFEDVPQHIAEAASEAYSCFSIRSYRASILMARSVLEATAKDKGIDKGSLASKIDGLEKSGVISKQIQDEAHEIRYLGNDMAHGDFVEPVSEEDADDMLGFLATFLDYVYQMPAAIRRRQETRKNRGMNPNS
jgi:hypothetical protein